MVDPTKKKKVASASQEHDKLVQMLLDQSKPVEQRAKMLVHLFIGAGDPTVMQGVVQSLLTKMTLVAPAVEVEKLKQKYDQALKELETGSPRPATFIALADVDIPGPKPRAHVITPDGHERIPFASVNVNAEDLRRGQTVYLDAEGTAIVGSSNRVPVVGPEAKFLRRLPNSDQVEVTIRDDPIVLDAAAHVLEAIDAGQVSRDDKLLICANRQFAFRVIEAEEDRRYRFIDRMKVPNVWPAEEIGNPHSCLQWLVRRTSLLLFRQDLVRKYHARNRVSLLMTGPTGTGKTLTIKGFGTLYYEMLRRRTGLEFPESRTIRVKLSDELSMYLGQSDKNFDRLFSDIELLAAQPVETAHGEKILLPVVVIFEEVEGVARRRSDGGYDGTGGVMDRILTTLLQRLDDPLDDLAHLPLIFISTSNRPEMIDMAMFRRLGGKVAHFKRLQRRGLAAVLDKKIKPGVPLAARNGTPHEALRRRMIDQVVAEMYSSANDAARIELTLRDGTKLTKHGHEFLTGAVVEQALSEAIDEVMFHASDTDCEDGGLDSAGLIRALQSQIDTLVTNVTSLNASDYVDLPEHTQVANVRRLSRTNGHMSQLLRP